MQRIWNFSNMCRRRPPFKKIVVTITTLLLLFFLPLLIATAFISSLWNFDTISRFSFNNLINETKIISQVQENNPPKKIIIPLDCVKYNQTETCPTNYPKTFQTQDQDYPSSKDSIPSTCPDYFRWIGEDLSPWKNTGITREMIERANRTAHFRLIIVENKVYIHKNEDSLPKRDDSTIWSILQLLRKYPGRLPDLELMFHCHNRPIIKSSDYPQPNVMAPPPVFAYCGDRWAVDIVFPDWTFWGRHQMNIKTWETMLRELKEGNKESKWIDREPYAYWRGNPFVADTRKDLIKCNVSDKQEWNARLYIQPWVREARQGFKHSNLASQCKHRYKIYIEGDAWSISEKYILACDSMTLYVKSRYYDFFTRSLQPLQHYWPIRENDKCKSIKFAVEWGNTHEQEAQEIGRAASNFIQEELKMDYVYDYMFHLLNEYAKLLKFKPVVPDGAVEVCSETMACMAKGLDKENKMDSLVKGPSVTSPCTLPPYEPKYLDAFDRTKLSTLRQVENWENTYWHNFNKQ